jgi:hypothetical protein
MAIAQSERDQLARWDGLAIQLRVSAHTQGIPLTPPVTPPVPMPPPLAPTPAPTAQQPLHWLWPWVHTVFIDPVEDDNK